MRSIHSLWFAAWFPITAGASPRVEFALGVLAEQRGDTELAAERIDRARESDPTAFPLMLRVAARRRATDDLAGASTLYREFAAGQPERLDAQLAYADFLRDASPEDDFATQMAQETLEKALGRFPGTLEIQERLFRIYESRERRDLSLAVFEELAAGTPGSSRTLAATDMARTLFPKDDPVARARIDGLFEQACRAEPADPVLARAASKHFRTTGRLAEAIGILAAHVAADPSSLELRIDLGIFQLMAERAADGERTLRELLEIDPRKSRAHQTLAKLYRKQGRADEARPHAAEVLKLEGGTPAEFVTLADEFLAAGLPREARLLLEKAVYFHAADPALAAKLAVATRRDPETRAAASRWFREAEALSGKDGPATDPVFLSEFAEALLEGGQTAAAEERLRLAIRSFPAERKEETAVALRRLAGIWQRENRNAEAAKALLQRADSLDAP
jgi:tetratricopeptide (TPR) repeat protein